MDIGVWFLSITPHISTAISSIGLGLALVANFSPQYMKSFGNWLVRVAKEPIVLIPSWLDSKPFRIVGCAVVSIISGKFVAEVCWEISDKSLLAYLLYLLLLVSLSLLIYKFFKHLLGWFFYLVFWFCKVFFFPLHLITIVCEIVNPKSEPVVGLGLLLAVTGFALNLVPS